MKNDIRSLAVALAELELAGLMSCADGASRFAEITMRYARRCTEAVNSGIGAGALTPKLPPDAAGADLLAAHGDYLRELAAMSSWLMMNFLNRLELARSGRNASATNHSDTETQRRTHP